MLSEGALSLTEVKSMSTWELSLTIDELQRIAEERNRAMKKR